MKKYFELLLEYKILLYICSVDVGLHLEMQSISILSIFKTNCKKVGCFSEVQFSQRL